MGNLHDAEVQARRALDLCETSGDDRRGAWARIMLSQALIYQGRFDEPALLLDRALDVFERIGDFRGRAWVGFMTASQAEVQRDFVQAIRLRGQGEVMARQSGGFQHELSANLARLGDYYMRLGQPKEALERCQESLAISLKMSNKLEYGHAYMVLG
jgi:tetratricopeptide (TPR) repeat protein